MVQRTKITPHEAMELHELITFKNLCATKSASMAALVKDEELKTMMQQDMTMGQNHITELQNLIQKAGKSSFDASSAGASINGAASTGSIFSDSDSSGSTSSWGSDL